MDKLIENLIVTGVPGIIVLFGLYLGKNLMENFFIETIEIKKKELEQESKNLQHQLDTKLQEFNIKFLSLHYERAEIIKLLYHKLIELQSSMYVFTRKAHIIHNDAKKEEQERIDRVNRALSDFTNHFLINKIFFSKSITNKIDVILNDYHGTGREFTEVLRLQKYPQISNVIVNVEYDKWAVIAQKVETFFPPLIEEIEDDFREILGVKN